MEKLDKKVRKGICRCSQYKKEISELKELVKELRIKEAELDSINKNINVNTEECIDKNIGINENNLQGRYDDMDELLQYKEEEKLKPEDFTSEKFNELFECNKVKDTKYTDDKPKITETLNKNYNPNILPIKHFSGYEKFDNDVFNKQFEESVNTLQTDFKNIFSPW